MKPKAIRPSDPKPTKIENKVILEVGSISSLPCHAKKTYRLPKSWDIWYSSQNNALFISCKKVSVSKSLFLCNLTMIVNVTIIRIRQYFRTLTDPNESSTDSGNKRENVNFDSISANKLTPNYRIKPHRTEIMIGNHSTCYPGLKNTQGQILDLVQKPSLWQQLGKYTRRPWSNSWFHQQWLEPFSLNNIGLSVRKDYHFNTWLVMNRSRPGTKTAMIVVPA